MTVRAQATVGTVFHEGVWAPSRGGPLFLEHFSRDRTRFASDLLLSRTDEEIDRLGGARRRTVFETASQQSQPSRRLGQWSMPGPKNHEVLGVTRCSKSSTCHPLEDPLRPSKELSGGPPSGISRIETGEHRIAAAVGSGTGIPWPA
jgi:hypothetical protein